MKKIYLFILALGIITFSSLIKAQTSIPELKQRINDFTNTLSFQEWQMLEDLLKSYEDTASTQIVVLLVNSLNGVSIDEFAAEEFETNKIGEGTKNNGVLLVIVKQDYGVRIHAAAGLDDVLTESVTSQIIGKEIVPYLKSNNYFGGIATGVDAIIRVISGEYQIDGKGKWVPIYTIILVVLGILFVIFILLPMIIGKRGFDTDGKRYGYFARLRYLCRKKSKGEGKSSS